MLDYLKQQLEPIKAPYLLAVSGGRDSVALLHLCHALKLKFTVAHLDHALRPDSSEDADFVRQVCANLGLPLITERINVAAIAAKRHWSLETAARHVRYEFLARVAKKSGCHTILTAHHLEDNAETVLLQLLRGSARAYGIAPRNRQVFRPLLGVSKTQLEQYLRQHHFVWREDSSNQDPQFTRNWLRLEVMPHLHQRYPKAAESLAQFARIARAEDDFLEQQAKLSDWTDLRLEPLPIQRRAIRKILEQAGLSPDFLHTEALRLALGSKKVARVSLLGNHLGVVQNGQVKISPPRNPPQRGGNSSEARVGELPAARPQNNARFWSPQNVSVQIAQAAFPAAVLRTREPGDVITLSGGTKKLAQVLIDRKIPREQRDTLPVLAIGQQVVFVGLEPPLLDASLPQAIDPEFTAMRLALQQAHIAATRDEVPVGAVILHNGAVLASAHNRAQELADMTRHAELEVIRLACQVLQTPYLTGCTLVVTLEPCLMCLGAILEARVGRIVFATRNPKNGALGGVLDATRAAWNHRFSVRAGLLEKEAQALLSTFFAAKR